MDALGQTPQVLGLLPAGGLRGQATVVRVEGRFLAGAKVLVGGSGLTVKAAVVNAAGDMVMAEIASSADATFGPHEIRIVTPQGVSNGAYFWVDIFPNIAPVIQPTRPKPALLIPRDKVGVVNGRITAPSGNDRYTFSVQVGETWAFDCFSSRLRSKLAATLELRDEKSILIKQGAWDGVNDPRFAHKFARAGSYTISIADLHGSGGPEYTYRLLVGRTAFVTRFLPRGERPGATVGIQMEGPNVPARTPATAAIPNSARPGTYWADVRTPTGRAALIPFLVTDLPAAAVTETDFTMPLPLPPVALDGAFARYPKVRFFFHADKGDRYEFELLGKSIGSKIRAAISLLDASGKVVADAVDDESGAARVELAAAEEGIYTIEARDEDGKTGLDRSYRLNVRQIGPDFRLVLIADRIVVPKQGAASLTVRALRLGGYSGPITLHAEGLPAGVTAAGATIAESKDFAEIVFAAAGAGAASAPIRVIGDAPIDGKSIAREAQPRDLVQRTEGASNGARPDWRPWNMLILAVVDPAGPAK